MADNRRNKIDEEEARLRLLEKELAVTRELVQAKKDDLDTTKKLNKELQDLNNQMLEQHGSEYWIRPSSGQITEQTITKLINKVNKSINKLNKPEKTQADIKSENLQIMLEHSMEDAVSSYERKLSREYDKLLKEATTPKQKKVLGKKQDYIDKFITKYRETLTKVAQETFQDELDFNIKIGRKSGQETVNTAVRKGLEYAQDDINDLNEQAAKDLKDSAKNFKDVSSIFLSLGKTLLNYFVQGANNQTKVFENTFSDFSVRTGITQTQYISKQLSTSNNLRDNIVAGGATLFDNIAMSELMQTWDDLAKLGMNQETIFANAIDSVITNKVVPYLETSTLNFNLLNSKLNGKFIQDIRGITQANIAIAENNYATQKLLQTIIDEVQPMSDEAIENLAQGSTEVTTMINSMISAGMDEATAVSYATQLFKAQKYSDEMLRSGTTSEKLFITDALQNNVNFYDPTQWNNAIGLAIDREQLLMQGQSYNTTESGLYANIVSRAYGIDYGRSQGVINLANKGITGTSLVQKTDTTQDAIEKGAEQVLSNYAKGKYQTATQKQLNATENIATIAATVEEKIGTIGNDILSSLGDILSAIIGSSIGNSVASAIGIKNIAGGFGKLFASGASGVLLGGVLPVAAAMIAGGINSKARDTEESALYDEWAYNNNNNLAGNVAAQKVMGTYTKTTKGAYDSSGFWGAVKGTLKIAGDILDTSAKNIDNVKNRVVGGFTGNYDKLNSNHFKQLFNLQDMKGAWSNDKKALQRLHWLLLADYANGSGSQLSDIGTTHDELINLLQDPLTPSVYDAIATEITSYRPVDEYGKDIKSVSDTYINNLKEEVGENFHRQGLAKVPYDGYQAVLHAGETIMTASTTATMENMVQAFRESQNQNYRIDAAIQEQTSQLVAKIDEVINAIGSTGNSPTNFNSPSEKLRNSLRTLTNPLAFQG